MKKIVLMGNPNVGKSSIFSQITGVRVTISNYPGTTVEFTHGKLNVGEAAYEVIDAPGTYSLEPTCRAEEVALDLLKQADVVINVVDATNLERNLYLTAHLLERHVPMVVALNMFDEAGQKGIDIDVKKLEQLLGVPVTPTVALSGEGVKEVIGAVYRAVKGTTKEQSPQARWVQVGELVSKVQRVTHRHRTWLEQLQIASLKLSTGIPIALVVLSLAFAVTIGVGELLHEFINDYIFEPLYAPVVTWLSRVMGGEGFWHDVFIGRLVAGEICFEESMGLLTTGVFVALAVVFPFLMIFYLVLGFFEDAGYLPRLAVIVDRMMHRLGLHGFAIIPMILGFGCNVPAALATRNLESRRERLIASTLMAVAIPCMAQIALIVGLLGRYGWSYVVLVFSTLFLIWVVLGLALDRIMPGFTPSMILEIPPYRLPGLKAQLKKLMMRLKAFFTHAIPYILGGILFVNVLFVVGVVDFLAEIFGPVVRGLLGLPGEAISTLLVGFLRKDVAVAMLEPLQLTAKQFTIGATVLATYFPCAATFAVLARELGIRDMTLAAGIMISTAVISGSLLNLLLDNVFSSMVLSLLFIFAGIILAIVAGGTSDRRELLDIDLHQ